MVVVINRDEYEAKEPSALTVEEAIMDTFEDGQLGNLKVEPQSLVMRGASALDVAGQQSFKDSKRKTFPQFYPLGASPTTRPR